MNKTNVILCIAVAAMLGIAAGIASVRLSASIAPAGGVIAKKAEKVAADRYVIINRSFDISGTVILDFAVNGDPRTAYFPTLERCNLFVEYLASIGDVEHLGGEE